MSCVRWTRFGRVVLVFLVLSAASRWGNAAVGQVRPAHQSPEPVSFWSQLGDRLQAGLGDLLSLIGLGSPEGGARTGGRQPAAAACSSTAKSGTSAGSSGTVQPGDLFPGIDPNGGLAAGN
jgi:hypothetical protein